MRVHQRWVATVVRTICRLCAETSSVNSVVLRKRRKLSADVRSSSRVPHAAQPANRYLSSGQTVRAVPRQTDIGLLCSLSHMSAPIVSGTSGHGTRGVNSNSVPHVHHGRHGALTHRCFLRAVTGDEPRAVCHRICQWETAGRPSLYLNATSCATSPEHTEDARSATTLKLPRASAGCNDTSHWRARPAKHMSRSRSTALRRTTQLAACRMASLRSARMLIQNGA